MGSSTRLGICIVSPFAYGAFTSVDTGHVGGIETQAALMARWFAGRGYDVSMIALDEGQSDGIKVDGVCILKTSSRDAGIRGLRFLHPRWTSLCQAMKRADADVYYYNCGDLGLGQVVAWCRRYRKKSVYSVASDPDCDVRLPVLRPLRERVLYKYGLRHVDSIIVQTQHQQQMLRDGFGRDSIVIPMPCMGFGNDGQINEDIQRNTSAHVLWVGRISAEKRFEWLLDIAERCPEITFNVIGAANSDFEYASQLTRRAAAIPNVRMHGRVPHAEIAKYYRQSRVLCCTSAYEGFPNTFLEAWSVGMPVISTFDPDNIIQSKGCGIVANNLEDIVTGLKKITQSPETWQKASAAARHCYIANHAIDVSMPRFERIFLDIVVQKS